MAAIGLMLFFKLLFFTSLFILIIFFIFNKIVKIKHLNTNPQFISLIVLCSPMFPAENTPQICGKMF